MVKVGRVHRRLRDPHLDRDLDAARREHAGRHRLRRRVLQRLRAAARRHGPHRRGRGGQGRRGDPAAATAPTFRSASTTPSTSPPRRSPPSTSRTSSASASSPFSPELRAGRPLPPGGVIPVSRTTPAIDLTAVFDGFQPLFSALSPDQVNQLAGSIIDVFQGESGTISNIVAETAALTNNLADRQQVIDTLLTSLSSLLNTVGVHDTQLGQLIGNFDTLMTGLAGSRAQLGSAIDNLATAESTTSGLLNEAQPTLNQDIQALASGGPVPVRQPAGARRRPQGLPRSGRHAHQDPELGQLDQRLPLQPDDQRVGPARHLARPRREPDQPVPEPGDPPLGSDRRPGRPHGELLVKRFRERNRATDRPGRGRGRDLVLVVGALEFPTAPPHPRQRHLPGRLRRRRGPRTRGHRHRRRREGGIHHRHGPRRRPGAGHLHRVGRPVWDRRPSAAAKVLSPVGTEYMEVVPVGLRLAQRADPRCPGPACPTTWSPTCPGSDPRSSTTTSPSSRRPSTSGART